MQEQIVELIAAQRAGLLGFLAGTDDWDRPTSCGGWSAKDVLAHLVEGELNVGRIYRGEITEQGYIDADEAIARWRPLPGEAVRAALWQHGTATQRVLDVMSAETWRKPIRAFGCREIRHLVRLHLFEAAVHGHDLTEALGGAPLWEPCLPFLVEFVVRAAPPTFGRRSLDPEGALAVRSGGRSWVLDGRGQTWVLGDESDADAEVEMDPESLVLMATGRAPQEALGRVTVSGDAALAQRVLEAWRVV